MRMKKAQGKRKKSKSKSKKGKGKGKRTAKEAAKKSTSKAKKAEPKSELKAEEPTDLVQARKDISVLVTSSAKDIAQGVIRVAKEGQLAPAKYLFEAVGLYPATEESSAEPDHSLAHTLLKRMGLPTEPVISEDDPTPILLRKDADPSLGKPPGTAGNGMQSNIEQRPDAAKAEEQAVTERREDA